MEVIKKLELELQKYLRLRKASHMFEFVCLAAIFIVFLYSGGGKVIEIISCVAAVIIVPESFLLTRRTILKTSIRDRKLLANNELDFYTEMKAEFEKIRNEFITQGSKNFVSDECKQLVWKEEMGTGWLSFKIKECEEKCNEAKQTIESLESIKKRLVIF
jgi:hypothetical protein